MKLYGSLTSPYVRKVRVFARERAIPYEMVVEDPWQSSERLLAMTPVGKVPVLELDDGRILFDSLTVIEYLDSLSPPEERLLPPVGDRRWAVLRWHGLAHGLIDATVARLLENRRPESLRMPDRIRREEDRVACILQALEREVPEEGWIAGSKIGLADLMVGVALSYVDFRYTQEWRPNHPRLEARLAALVDRPSFRETEPSA